MESESLSERLKEAKARPPLIGEEREKALKSLDELSLKIDNLIPEKHSLEDKIKLQFDNLNDMSISRDSRLIAEIKRFETVVERAYYVQQEMETPTHKVNFITKLFGTR